MAWSGGVFGVATMETSDGGIVSGGAVSIAGDGADVEFLDVADPGYPTIGAPPGSDTDTTDDELSCFVL